MTDLAHRREANRSAMPNLDELEALAGPLPKGREYEVMMGRAMGFVERDATIYTSSDAALAEAYAVIERQAEENTGWKRSHDVWCDDLANIDSLKQRAEKSEAEARRWEWVAKEASRGRRTPDGPLLDTLLARYEEAGHWTA